WKFKVPGGPVMGSSAVVENRTFVAGCDSSLHVLDTTKGTEVTAVELGGQVGATAAVAGDRLYVGTMSSQGRGVGWEEGQVLWTYEAAGRKQAFYASVAITDRLVIAGSRDKLVHALDRQTGKAVWTFPTKGRVDSSPVVDGRRVFVGSLDGHLYVLDLEKG